MVIEFSKEDEQKYRDMVRVINDLANTAMPGEIMVPGMRRREY